MNHGIIIHPEDFADLMGMSAEECGLIVQNMLHTFFGEETVAFEDRYLTRVSNDMCGRVLRDKELSERQSRNGKKGGAKVGHTNYNQAKVNPELNQSLTKVKPKLNPNTNTNTNTNNKRLYGECQNVRLSDEEHKKLTEKGYSGLIDELSLYIASKGDKYKDHYATVLSWARKREKERVSKNTFTRMTNRTDYDMDELERVLVKN